MFLDRDGVINRAMVRDGKPYPPAILEEFELLPGAKQTMEALHKAGFLIIIVTNQPDVATGVQSREMVEAMHDRLRAAGYAMTSGRVITRTRTAVIVESQNRGC